MRDEDDEAPGGVVCDAFGCTPIAGDDAGPMGPVDDWPADWIAREDELLALVNALRAAGGECPGGARPAVPALTSDPALRKAARDHSRDMGENGYFDHFSQDGRSPFDRMSAAGYDGQPGGENIAGGAETAEGTFQMWLSSSGHCANMTSGSFTEIGVGYAFVEGSAFGHYWTQTFGSR